MDRSLARRSPFGMTRHQSSRRVVNGPHATTTLTMVTLILRTVSQENILQVISLLIGSLTSAEFFGILDPSKSTLKSLVYGPLSAVACGKRKELGTNSAGVTELDGTVPREGLSSAAGKNLHLERFDIFLISFSYHTFFTLFLFLFFGDRNP